jgi:hypothetical protein
MMAFFRQLFQLSPLSVGDQREKLKQEHRGGYSIELWQENVTNFRNLIKI